jgi:List-Bact-rpt repeat protein
MKKILIAVCLMALALVSAPLSAHAATYTLTVASSNPSSGVAITVSPNDLNGRNNGTTQFTRSYSSTTSISLTAPSTASGNTFQKWQRDGSDYSTNRTITFTLSSNRTMRAVYVTSTSSSYTLTVASSNPSSGVAINASPTDRNGQQNGTTQFTRSYNSGTSVQLTAPSSASNHPFQKWQRNGSDYSTNVQVSVTMSANTTMTAVFGSATTSSNYTVIARNDLGMHCACPSFAGFLLLPPYNTIRVQVIRKGGDSASIVSSGITVNYSLAEETDASLQTDPYFSQWIKYSPKLFPGFQPVVNGKVMGIAGYGISGTATYDSKSMSWNAVGIPAYPVATGDPAKDIMTDPLGGPKRDPYLTANITVKDTAGNTLGTTSTVVPVAFGGCCGCHLKLAGANGYPQTPEGSFTYMGIMHGRNSSGINISLIDPDGDGIGGPVRCSWCHFDPAMGEMSPPGVPAGTKLLPGANFTLKTSQYSFSDVLHRFHAKDQLVLSSAYDPNIARNCYDCHPGNNVNCYRGNHTKTNIWCTDCHGDLNQRVSTGQLSQPWQASTLPSCYAPAKGISSAYSCHASVPQTTWASNFGGNYINGRGGMSSHIVLCESCHGSAHAESPSAMSLDNVQNAAIHDSLGTTFPAGKDKTYTLGSCRICHTNESSTWSPNVMYGH